MEIHKRNNESKALDGIMFNPGYNNLNETKEVNKC